MRSSSCQITRNTVDSGERAAEGERGDTTGPWFGSHPITLDLFVVHLHLLLLQAELQGNGASFSDPMVLDIAEAAGAVSAEELNSLNFIQTKRKPQYLFSRMSSQIINRTSFPHQNWSSHSHLESLCLRVGFFMDKLV